jgi:hypothetical protein
MFRRLSILSLFFIAAGIFGVSNAAAQYFTVPPGPSITIDANPLAVKAGDKVVISWQAKPNPNTHSALIGCKGPGSGALWTWAAEDLPWGFSSGDISGGKSFAINGDTQYTVVCKDQSGVVSNNSVEVHTVLPLNCVSNSECNGQRVSVTAKLDIPNQTPSHEVSTAWSEGNYLKPPVTVSVNFYDTRPLWQKLEFWVPTIQQCADWSQGLVLWGSNFQTTLIQALPGTHRYPVSCYFTFGNQVISDEAVVNVVSSSTSTPTSTAAYQLTLEARDLSSGAPLKVPVSTSIKNGETTLVVGSDKAYNGNLSISVQTPVRIGTSAYKFNHWAFSDSPVTILSNAASISLNSDFPKRTAVAYYSLTSATTTTSTLQTYYYCSNNSCVSGRYASAADCKNANNTSCYNTAGECTAACPLSLPPGGKVQPKSENININISSSQACLPQGGVNNSTNISWNISGPSCPAGFSLTQGSNQLSCSSNIPNGPTGAGQGSSNTSITQTTNFSIFCSYDTFTCEKTYQCDQTQKVITNPDGTTSTITVWQTCTDKAVVNGGSSSNSTTVYYVQPPRIDGFAASPQNILLNKQTSLTWSFQASNSGTPTGQYCYPNGGSGDLSGWASGTKYNLSPEKIDNLSPQQNTTYNLTCRNEATAYANCYNESLASTTVNVYKPNLQEANPAALISSAFGDLLKRFGL